MRLERFGYIENIFGGNVQYKFIFFFFQEQLRLKDLATESVNEEKEKFQDTQRQAAVKNMDASLEQSSMESSLQKIETDVSQKEKQFEELGEQMKSLTNELESVNKELNQKTQEILHIRNETKEYIR